MLRFALCAAVSASLSIAVAAPLQIPHTGRISDASGAAVNGEASLVFRLWDAQSAGQVVWSETHPAVAIANGHYTVVLGTVQSLDTIALNGEPRWLSVALNGQPLGARTPVLSVPYAVRAATADAIPTGEIACSNAGQLRLYNEQLELCDGDDWRSVLTQGTLGHSASTPAGSCADILRHDPDATSGIYWIAPGGTAFQARCEENTGSRKKRAA